MTEMNVAANSNEDVDEATLGSSAFDTSEQLFYPFINKNKAKRQSPLSKSLRKSSPLRK